MEKEYAIDLTLKELMLLDTKVSEKAQKIIDEAKQENSYGFDLPIMNKILRKSEEIGTLTWKYKQIKSCSYCDKDYGYYTYPRSSRYHNKGDKNYDKPFYYSGIAFNEGYVTIKGVGDMCTDCEKKYNIIHRLIDYIIDYDLKIEIQKNDYKPSKYLKDDIKICYECGEEIQESKMKNNICPYCKAETNFWNYHKSTDKFVMIPNPSFKKEVQNIKKLVQEFNKKVTNEEDKLYMEHNKYDNKTFYVQGTKWTNGNRDVIVFNVESKTFQIGCFWKDKAEDFINELLKCEYKEINNNN